MKYLLMLLVISFTSLAETEIGIGYARINQDLFSTIEFKMDSVNVSSTYWTESGLGIRASLGQSAEANNELYVKGFVYTNRIDAIYSAALMFRHPIGGYFIEVGVGITDYKTTWKVNGKKASWGSGVDSGTSYFFGVSKVFYGDLKVRLLLTDAYRKHKKDYGKEATKSITLEVAKSF